MRANDTTDARKRLDTLYRDQRQAEMELRQSCPHRPVGNQQREVVPLNQSRYKDNPDILKRYPESAVVCDGRDGCAAIFNANMYSKDDVAAMNFQMSSIFEQIKLMAQLRDNEYEELMDAMDAWVLKISPVVVFYNKMVNSLADRNKKQNKDNKPTKGGIGIPKSGFNRAG